MMRTILGFLVVFGLAVSSADAAHLSAHGMVASGSPQYDGGSDDHGHLLPSDFSLLGSKWNPGPNAAQFGGNPAPGSATWSIMAAGTANPIGDNHGGTSVDFSAILALIPGGIDAVLNVWAAASGFTNLGEVADGGVQPGNDALPGAALGDIRIGAYAIAGSSVLAHAFQPAVAGMFSNGTIGGDVHFDHEWNWVDDPNDAEADNDFDAFTVMLHEIGHALGLGHSDNEDSVMYFQYKGGRRTLHADDIAGIQAIYGPPQPQGQVPEPATVGMFLLGALGVPFLRRRRVDATTAA